MKFREWYQTLMEVGTGTNCIAVFARPIIGGPVERTWPETIAGPDFASVFGEKPTKKKKKDDED